MSQHDFDIANQGFAGFRTDLNNALQALASLSSGTAAPATTYANQLWYETDTDTLWLRNEANSAWLSIMVINQSTGSPSFTAGNVGIGTTSPTTKLSIEGALNFSATAATPAVSASVYSPSASQLAFGTASTERMRIDASGNVSIGGYTPGLGTRLAMYGGIRFLTTETAANTYTGIGSIASDTVSISTSGTERMSIGTSGVVTIANLAGAGSRAVNASATGVLSAASDSRLKQEVPTASIAGLAEIMQLRPVAYKWLDDIENRGDDAAVELGFFADEAKDIIPSAAPMGTDGYYGFYDRAVIAALTKAVQEQQAIITALEARLTAANL
jgi:hypothetical protein